LTVLAIAKNHGFSNQGAGLKLTQEVLLHISIARGTASLDICGYVEHEAFETIRDAHIVGSLVLRVANMT
jgi:hypothetical protein